MYICVECKSVMICDKNGIGADFGAGHIYASDRYKCEKCGHQILATNPTAYYDPEYKLRRDYLDMSGPVD